MLDESYYFLPKELVYHYVAKLMKKHKAFEFAITEKEQKDKKDLNPKIQYT